MAPLIAFGALLLAHIATARQCSNFDIPIAISSRQGVFKEIPIETNLDAGAFAVKFTEYQKNYTATLLEGYQTLEGAYHISAQYCRPENGSNGIIQLLNHGIGFDKSYWDLPFDNYNYSYVNTALASGYSTLAIDRLGIGNSSHGDPLNEIQAQLEVQALNAVTTKLRNGEIKDVPQKYSKIIHVGHSFGSVQSMWLSSLYPNNTDGLILTGFSTASMFMPYIVAGWNLQSARLNQPERLGNGSSWAKYGQPKPFSYNYPSGYLVSNDLSALQYAFLYPGYFNLELAEVAEKTKQPVTTGELLTIGSSPSKNAFTGPVLIVTGEHDVPFCGGNCFGQLPGSNASSIPATAKMAFPSVSNFEAYIQPNTGHGINFHYNATAAYQVIQDYLGNNGLAA